MKPIQLYRTEEGKIVDGEGMEYQLPHKEVGAINNPLYRSKGLDIGGDVTVTGNLTVQQSQWVYLRGPITGSGALINGSITGSNLWIRDGIGDNSNPSGGVYGNLIVDTDVKLKGISLSEKREELERRIRECEERIKELSGIIHNIDDITHNVRGNKK